MTRPVVLALLVLTLAGLAALATKPAAAHLIRGLDIDHQEDTC